MERVGDDPIVPDDGDWTSYDEKVNAELDDEREEAMTSREVSTQQRTQEARVRRQAARRGWTVQRSRRRDTNAPDFGRWQAIAPDGTVHGDGHTLSLDQLENLMNTIPEDYCDHFDCACPPFVLDQRVSSAEWGKYVRDNRLGYAEEVPFEYGTRAKPCPAFNDGKHQYGEWEEGVSRRWRHCTCGAAEGRSRREEEVIPRSEFDYRALAGEQVAPVRNDGPDIQTLVQTDMAARYALGVARYGTGLQAHNGRDMMRDLYEELLDACVYIRGVMAERDGK